VIYPSGVQSPTAVEQSLLQQQLRAAGVLLFTCSETGDLIPSRPTGCDWHADFLSGSPMFRKALRQATHQWACDERPAPVESLPGMWLVPTPCTTRRRRSEPHQVAVMITESFLESEYFSAICQSGNQDAALARSMMLSLPPVSHSDTSRVQMLVQCVLESTARAMTAEQNIESTGQELAESYEEINLLYTIIQSMADVEQPERFVDIACHELLDTLPYEWIGTCLADNRERLKTMAGKFFLAGEVEVSTDRLCELAKVLLVDAEPNVPVILEPHSRADHAQFRDMGRTVLGHPITSEGRVIGLLLAGNKQGPDMAASSVDMKLLGATASHMAIFLENAALYDDLNGMFIGTLEALTASIDAKDRYTCGHSQRVAYLTQQLAIAIGLDEAVVKRMHIAGLVHDVGKIGVPESVLLKPGRLNDEEFAWIRKHPEMGHRILKDIPQLQDILPGVLYHHERYDGKGYPSGLAGEDIPLVARMIGLADAFDAMSSTRTYRSALCRSQVLNEIERCAGVQFDPKLAPLFVQLDFSEYDRLVEEHQAGSGSSTQSHRGAA